MESSEIGSLLEQLDDEIDDLEDSLAPLLKSALSTTSSKLPLLDKAKLYVLVTYAIESMLFSYLRLNGVKAREHPVFKELIRVKQYFGKIKVAEAPPDERPTVVLDKQAATRFIKAGLTGNDEYNSKGAQHQETGMTRSHTKFEDLSKATGNATSSPSVATEDSNPSHISVETAESQPSAVMNSSKKRKADAFDDSLPTSSLSCAGSDMELSDDKGKKSKDEKRRRTKSKKKSKDGRRSI